jgi:hypothetical protein
MAARAEVVISQIFSAPRRQPCCTGSTDAWHGAWGVSPPRIPRADAQDPGRRHVDWPLHHATAAKPAATAFPAPKCSPQRGRCCPDITPRHVRWPPPRRSRGAQADHLRSRSLEPNVVTLLAISGKLSIPALTGQFRHPLICGSINGHNQKRVLVPGAQPKLMTWHHTTCSRVPLCCGCVSWTGCSSSTSACRASTKGCGPGRFSGHVGGGLCGASLSGFWVGWAWGPGGVRLGRAAAGASGGLGCVAGCCLVIPAGIVARRGRARGG